MSQKLQRPGRRLPEPLHYDPRSDRLTRLRQLESHAHALMLDAMAAPQQRAHRKARAARNSAALAVTGLAFAALAALSGLWPLLLCAGALLVFAAAGFRRAVLLARPVDDDALTEAMRYYDEAVRDREAVELETEVRSQT